MPPFKNLRGLEVFGYKFLNTPYCTLLKKHGDNFFIAFDCNDSSNMLSIYYKFGRLFCILCGHAYSEHGRNGLLVYELIKIRL
jgi:hypothetical protein